MVRHESTRQCVDVEKAHPFDPITARPTHEYKWNNDIEGAKPKKGHTNDIGPTERENVAAGIAQRYKPSKLSQSTRRSDPLDPSYVIHGQTYGQIRGSKVKSKGPMRPLPNRALDTADICGPPVKDEDMHVGAQSHTLVAIRNFERFKRTQFRSINKTQDILGASASNPIVNPMLVTKRCTNPLTANKCAEYPYLGATETKDAEMALTKTPQRMQPATSTSPEAIKASAPNISTPETKSRPVSAQSSRPSSRGLDEARGEKWGVNASNSAHWQGRVGSAVKKSRPQSAVSRGSRGSGTVDSRTFSIS